MGRLLNTLISVFFWWTLFLLLLVIGFNLQLVELMNNVFNGNIHFTIVCILLLLSPVLYLVLYVCEFVKDRKDGLFVLDTIGLTILPYYWVIYKGLDFRYFEFSTWIYNLLNNLIWWGVVAYGVWAVILTNENNIIISKIGEFENQQIIIRLGMFFLVCILLYGVGRLLYHISGKAAREYMN